ncbi:beta-1,4-galactosyltransferase galt-1-like [Tiliqua scincoides]|uniref:beta-1,4-galactosyltransferase galt-1-like n=1 Tax=Tiliqua scincoides TaxID=71010 RepID=UPI0034635E5A
MARYSKRLHLVAAVFTLTVITFSYLQIRNTSPVPTSVVHLCSGTPASGTITPLKSNRAFIVAAYFDNRRNYRNATRLIGIAHHKDVQQLYCRFCCTPDGKVQVTKAEIDIHDDRFGFPYGATDLYCQEPKNCQPRYVSILGSAVDKVDQLPLFEIKNREATDSPVQFTVCVSPMYGEYNNILQFIQSMEMYKILGVDKVVIYKNSCSQLMEKVLDFYVTEGTVEIIPWPIDSYLSVSSYWHHSMDAKDIGYYGQITALNDCVYRNMYKSRYVLLNDIDEIILPVKHWNWQTMMRELQKQNPRSGIFVFENHIFPKTIFTPISLVNISSWSSVPGINILEHVIREPDRKHIMNPSKMIVDPRKVSQTSIHSVLKTYGWHQVHVKKDVALVYHCRIPLQATLPRESLIEDPTIWRYNVSLIENVNHVLQQTVL